MPRYSRMGKTMSLAAFSLAALIMSTTAHANQEAASEFETKTKIRVDGDGIWLESEIAPAALRTALPATDLNQDGHLDENELSSSREAILCYYASQVKLVADGRLLLADSTYFAFRSPASLSAVPDRFYIYHWYAMLRRPQHLRVSNRLFCDLENDCRHQGSLVSGAQILPFDFTTDAVTAHAGVAGTVEFVLGRDGSVTLVNPEDQTLQASYIWIGFGLASLLLLRLVTMLRTKWGRQRKSTEVQRPAKQVIERSPVGV